MKKSKRIVLNVPCTKNILTISESLKSDQRGLIYEYEYDYDMKDVQPDLKSVQFEECYAEQVESGPFTDGLQLHYIQAVKKGPKATNCFFFQIPIGSNRTIKGVQYACKLISNGRMVLYRRQGNVFRAAKSGHPKGACYDVDWKRHRKGEEWVS